MNTVSNKNKILLALAGFIFIINCVVLLFTYSNTPSAIIIHSYQGGKDSYGNKSYLWWLVVLNAILLAVITLVVINYQRWMRLTPEMTQQERTESIDNGRLILAIVAIKTSIVFSIILFK